MAQVYKKLLNLDKNKKTTVHLVCSDRKNFGARVVMFDKPIRLLDWCEQNTVSNAINGGFFGNELNGVDNGLPVGEVWIGGEQLAPTNSKFDRGCLYINSQKEIRIGLRSSLPQRMDGDLLEVGPLLIEDGKLVCQSDSEGFAQEAEFFDNDVTVGRAQRVAIGYDKDTVWLAVSEGRSPSEAGLTLGEMANFILDLGASEALNLDGGSGSSLVINQKLVNKPRMGEDRDYREFPRGREIVTAIVLDSI